MQSVNKRFGPVFFFFFLCFPACFFLSYPIQRLIYSLWISLRLSVFLSCCFGFIPPPPPNFYMAFKFVMSPFSFAFPKKKFALFCFIPVSDSLRISLIPPTHAYQVESVVILYDLKKHTPVQQLCCTKKENTLNTPRVTVQWPCFLRDGKSQTKKQGSCGEIKFFL